MIAWIVSSLKDPDDRRFITGIYIEYKRLMFATAKKYISNPADQEDIVQTAVEKLMKKISVLRLMERCTLAAYIVYTIRSVAVDFLRKEKRTAAQVISLEDYMVGGTEPADVSMEAHIEFMGNQEQLKALWSKLSEEDRILLEGKYVWEQSDKELAEILHCKPSSIRMMLTRARRRALNNLSEKE